jgi:hypothetical protein
VRAAVVVAALAACRTPEPKRARVPNVTLVSVEGHTEPLATQVRSSRYTVLLFFTSHCPVQRAHDARVRELAQAAQGRGFSFVGVSSEIDADLRVESAKARERGMPFAIWGDRGAALADGLAVEFSTHAVVVDSSGSILYSGGLDSDAAHLTPSAKLHLRNAIEDLLAGREVSVPRTEPLGCPLRKH